MSLCKSVLQWTERIKQNKLDSLHINLYCNLACKIKTYGKGKKA
jgi:hypothetical protein